MTSYFDNRLVAIWHNNVVAVAFMWIAILVPIVDVNAQSAAVNVMTFNVWTAEGTQAGRNKIVEIIQAGNADIIGLQEMGNSAGQSVASTLGYHYYQQSASDIQIISRFPIIGHSTANYGALIELAPGHQVWLFNAHLAPYPYQPYDLRDGTLAMNEAAVIAAAEAARGSQVDSYLADMSSALASGTPVFFTGDFNEPSHLDWTEAGADATERPFDLKVEYPASKKITDAGMTDTMRAVRPDEVNDRGYTWTPGYPPPNLSADEVHDRIDLIYYRGAGVIPSFVQNIGLSDSNTNTDIAVPGYNSDHRAVVTSVLVPAPDESVLTFSGLQHNPGNDSALNAGNYGDRWVTTPNVTIEFSATPTSTWDTYDGDQDFNGINNWNGGVGQLQWVAGSAEYDVAFTADEEFGVIVESFDLADYVNYAAGHTVNWELWSGPPDTGSLLAEGQEIIEADAINSVTTGVSQPNYGLLTLRIEHVLGSGVDLAVDNIVFRQDPAPMSQFVADSFTALRGFYVSGNLADTFESDDSYLKYNAGITAIPSEPPVWLVFDGTLASDSPTFLSTQLEASANTVGITQSVEMFNFNTGQYDVVGSTATQYNVDSVQTIDISAQISDYVQDPTGSVRTRLGWRQEGVVLLFPWTISVDQVLWSTN